MSDPAIKQFYKNVKDDSWTNIEHYGDFVKLPQEVQSECLDVHQGKKYISELYEQKFWNNLQLTTCYGWKYDNLIFLPILKCGSTYYNNLFGTQLGWEQHQISVEDFDNYNVVACVIHPLTKYLKGITEWIWSNVSDPGYHTKMVEVLIGNCLLSFPDHHSEPYSLQFPDVLNKVHIIPADIMSEFEVQQAILNFFKSKGHPEIAIPVQNQRLNVSSTKKQILFNQVKQAFDKKLDSELLLVYQVFCQDLSVYKSAVDNFLK
jgi:hypothetical protein